MNVSVRNDPVRIALIRLSEATAAMIRMVIERFARTEFAIVAPAEADALVVDADRHFAKQSLAELQSQHPSLPMLLLSTDGVSLDNAVTLRKPIRIQEFLGAARSLHACRTAREGPPPAGSADRAKPTAAAPTVTSPDQPTSSDQPLLQPPEAAAAVGRRTHRPGANSRRAPSPHVDLDCCGDAPDLAFAALTDPAQSSGAHFDDRAGLLGTLRAAARQGIEQNKALTVLGLPDALYVTCPQPAQAITQLDNDTLRATCAPGSNPQLRFCSIAAVPQAARSWRRIRLDSLLWDLALWSAHGRLPAGVSGHERMKLTAWPNFTRLTLTPHALPIAALWVTGYLSPFEVARKLDIAQRYVFALCSAAETAGLFEREKRRPSDRSDAVAGAPPTVLPGESPQIEATPTRNLLKRILGKLLHAR